MYYAVNISTQELSPNFRTVQLAATYAQGVWATRDGIISIYQQGRPLAIAWRHSLSGNVAWVWVWASDMVIGE